MTGKDFLKRWRTLFKTRPRAKAPSASDDSSEHHGQDSPASCDEKILDRLKVLSDKLRLLKSLDAELTIFGASSHEYASIPVKAEQLKELEARGWPMEYLCFMQYIGSGAGPFYGIETLDHSLEEEKVVHLLRQKVDKDGLESEAEVIAKLLGLGATRNSGVPFCDFGCGERFLLVVEGPEKGSVWFDRGFGDASVRPVEDSFLDFYEQWLDQGIGQFLPG